MLPAWMPTFKIMTYSWWALISGLYSVLTLRIHPVIEPSSPLCWKPLLALSTSCALLSQVSVSVMVITILVVPTVDLSLTNFKIWSPLSLDFDMESKLDKVNVSLSQKCGGLYTPVLCIVGCYFYEPLMSVKCHRGMLILRNKYTSFFVFAPPSPRKCWRVPDTLTQLESKKHPVDPLPLFVCVLLTLSNEENNQGLLLYILFGASPVLACSGQQRVGCLGQQCRDFEWVSRM